jgi:hypothetical protein
VADVQPGTQIEIYLIDYNRKSGEAEFAAKTGLPEGDGCIDIDFRWLVRRCLDWYRSKGTSVAEIETVSKFGKGQSGYDMRDGAIAPINSSGSDRYLNRGFVLCVGPPERGNHVGVGQGVHTLVFAGRKVLLLSFHESGRGQRAVCGLDRRHVPRFDLHRVGFPSEKFQRLNIPNAAKTVVCGKTREEREKKELGAARASFCEA